MKNIVMKKRGFTLIEIVLVLCLLTILIGIGVIIYTSTLDAADEKVCNVQCAGAKQLYCTYLANGGEPIADGTVGTKFLVESGFLQKEYECPNGGVYTWSVDKSGNAVLSCSVHEQSEEPEPTLTSKPPSPTKTAKPPKPTKTLKPVQPAQPF